MQTVPAEFNKLLTSDVQNPSWALRASFTKEYDASVTFFTLDTSVLDGAHVLAQSTDNPLQQWDKYNYKDYSDRVKMLSCQRQIEFPYSVASSIADFEVANYDGYFTPNSTSPISAYNLPKRPVRLYMGMYGTILPQFVGLTTETPQVSRSSKTATFTAMDFLTQIYDMSIHETIAMRDVRTDEVLASIFQQFGLSASQYNLAKGRNVIPFVFYEKGTTTAGDVIRKLMEAEMGLLWLSEEGIIRFVPRLQNSDTSVEQLTASNIVDIRTSSDSKIINKVKITSQLREVQPFQIVYLKADSAGDHFVISPGQTRTFQASLEDPIISAVQPTLGQATSVSWFTALTATGAAVPGNISVVSSVIRTNSYDITFTNNNSFAVEIAKMEIWGEPAKVVDVIDYVAKKQTSIDEYDEQVLTIENNFIQSVNQCDSLALPILDEYQSPHDALELTVKANPARQLGDVVDVDVDEYQGTYQIVGITNKLHGALLEQIIRLRYHTSRQWFVIDESVLNGPAVLAP